MPTRAKSTFVTITNEWNMRTNILAALLSITASLWCISVQAQSVSYCLNYGSYVDGIWQSIDSLTRGHNDQEPRLVYKNGGYRFESGVEKIDRVISYNVLAIQYGKRLYVNCRNLRGKRDFVISDPTFAQGYRYDNDKLVVAVYHYNSTAFGVIIGPVPLVFSPGKPAQIEFTDDGVTPWISYDTMNDFRCYLIDSIANKEGHYIVTRLDDKFMEELLKDDQELLKRYKSVKKKKIRQSASNILPILMDKGLVVE